MDLTRLVYRLMSFYPPYFGAGIRVRYRADGSFEASMRLRPWNRNAYGTHFGGSLYSMCDPFFALILVNELGRDYIAWDRAATIRFRRPGRGRVSARFAVAREQVAAIRDEVDRTGRAEAVFEVAVRDAAGEVVAELEKQVSVRRRDGTRP